MTRRDLLARGMSAGIGVLAAPMLNFGRCRLAAASTREYSVRTVDIVGRSLVIDMLGLFTLNWAKLGRWHREPSTFTKADFEILRDSGIDIFHPAVDLNRPDSHPRTISWLQNWGKFLAGHPEAFLPILQHSDVNGARRTGKIGVLLGMQNSDHFRSADDIPLFYSMGQRLSQLTYNRRNRIGSGCIERNDEGLTELGFNIVEGMNTAGMIIDVSHAGQQTCLDAFSASRKPVLITHSNCKALVPHPRCKSDEVIKAMAKTGGVMGVTSLRPFVTTRETASVEDALDHFDHLKRLVGIEHVGIGSDTDLGSRDAGQRVRRRSDISGLNHPLRIYDLAEGFVRRGYSDRSIESILGGNFHRAMAQIL